MSTTRRRTVAAGLALGVAGATVVLTGAAAGADRDRPHWTSVPAVGVTRGVAAPNVLSPGFVQHIVAQGATRLENPTADVPYYGYNGNGTLVPDPTLTQSPGHPVEASKTEPDKNTYLRLPGLRGADPNYGYGTHFLYQGHEGGTAGYLTRVNLDADAAHRVTLLATKLVDGTPIPTIDGSTWDPWARRLLFTAELGSNGAVLQATPDVNATSAANAGFGGWGGAYRLTQDRTGADEGRLSLLFAGDQAHTGFDNAAFFDRDHVAFVEDAGDTVHAQRGAFDSGYLLDVEKDYGKGGEPVRFLAEGRDASATIDSMLAALGNGFQNDGDNEITGIYVSDGDPGTDAILGAKVPRLFHDGWRLFWTQQHGDNITWQVVPED